MADLSNLLDDAYSALLQDDLQKARQLLDQARRQDANAGGDDLGVVLLEVELLEAEGQEDLALAAMEEVRAKQPKNALLAYHHARLLLDNFDDTDEARPLLETLYKVHQNKTYEEVGLEADEVDEFASGVLVSFSYCCLLDMDPKQALAYAEEAVALDGDDAEALLAKAAALFDLGRADEAKASAQAVVQADANVAEAHWLLGRIELAMGDEAAAKNRRDRAMGLAPGLFPDPVRTDAETMRKLLDDAKDELPDVIANFIDKADVAIQDLPAKDGWQTGTPPGTSVVVADGSLTLFQRNLELEADTEEALVGVIADAVAQEIITFLELDEDDLLA